MSAETPSLAVAERPLVAGRALRVRGPTRAVVLLVLGALPVSIAVVNLAKPGDAGGWAAVVFTSILCAGLGWFMLRPRFWVDARGIASRAPFGKRTSIAWADVTEVAAEPATGGYVIRASGTHLVVLGGLEGLDALASLVLTHVPASSLRSDAIRRSLEIRAQRFAPRLDFACPAEPTEPATLALAQWRDNPFYVLGVAPDASRADVERAGRKLLGLLEIGASSAKGYDTPFGRAERTPEQVRAALAELAIPERRAAREVEAHLAQGSGEPPEAPADDPTRPWPDAFRAGGWRPS
jgi:hypothetical protein